MGITRRFAGGSGAAAADVSSQKCQQMALALAEKELEIRKLNALALALAAASEYKRKYEALTSTLKALADGAGHVALPDAVAASGAREQDKKDERDKKDKKPVGRPLAKEEEEKNFALKVHFLGKPVVADSFGKIHEKVENPYASGLRRRREAYARDRALRAALSGPGAGPVAAVEDAASGARRTDDSSGASTARAQGNAGGQSSSASGAAAAAAEEEDRRDDEEADPDEEPRSKKTKNCTRIVSIE